MKIIYITPGCFDKGGISRYNRYQIDALREIFGVSNIKVFSLLGPDENKIEGDFSVTWYGSGPNLLSKLMFVYKIFVSSILFKPDFVHIAHVNFSGIFKIMSWFTRSKTILNTYGHEVWSGLSKDAAYGLKSVDYVISDCHYTAEYLEKEGFRQPQTTEVIWDCVDLDRFNNQPGRKNEIKEKYQLFDRDKSIILLCLGRLSFSAAHKGYERLIEVFAKLKEHNAKLIFAGKGDMVSHLKKLVNDFGLEDNIMFAGMIHDDDMAAIYSYAHIFSLVSDRGKNRGEGIPLTPLEAMACKVPIIVGNQDGSKEAIFDNKNGFSIDPFDLEEHARVLINLIEDDRLRLETAKSAEEIATGTFNFQLFKEKHGKFFEKIKHKNG